MRGRTVTRGAASGRQDHPRSLIRGIYAHRYLYLMIMPTFVWFVVFQYVPMGGVLIAFQNYHIGSGMFGGGDWVGLAVFRKLFGFPEFWRSIVNTFIISFFKTGAGLAAAILIALMMNEAGSRRYRSFVQTVLSLPVFFSWVVVTSFLITMLRPDEGLNLVLKNAGLPSVTLVNASQFRAIAIISDTWKNMGYNSIIFTAAIAGIDISLYESASLDGASRIQKVLHITLPSIRNVILVVFILWIGFSTNAGFDQIFNLYNPAVYSTGDIIDTYVYHIGFSSAMDSFSLATAAGLFKCVISLALVFSANLLTRNMEEKVLF